MHDVRMSGRTVCWMVVFAASATGCSQSVAGDSARDDASTSDGGLDGSHDDSAMMSGDGSFVVPDANIDSPVPTSDASIGDCGVVNDSCLAGIDQICLVGGYMIRGADTDPSSSPMQTVFVQTFAIDQNEVTVAAYRDCVARGDCTLPTPDVALAYYRDDMNLARPVMGLTLAQMEAFCGVRGRRLPTETEWERAVRALSGREYAWGSDPPTCGTNAQGCESGPAPVGTHAMDGTSEGVMDLIGNVAEATSDRWEVGGYGVYGDAVCNPAHPLRIASDTAFVIRGCSWRLDATIQCTGFLRRGQVRSAGSDDVGFRCAK